MSLSVGIVGLPNVGKSTLFNSLLRKQQAYAANFPFATIEPNVGVVPVPDRRLEFLAETVASANSKIQIPNDKQILNSNIQFQNKDKWPPIVPAVVEFVDIAGLIAGAHKGEGLGNKFLSHVRQTDAICHVVRAFENEDIVRHESVAEVNPKADFETIETELALADLSTLENQKPLKGKIEREDQDRWNAVEKIKVFVEKGKAARLAELTDEEAKQAKMLGLLTMKPILVALNVGEGDLGNAEVLERKYSEEFGTSFDQTIAICAKVEEELASLSETEAIEYLHELGIENSGLERIIKKAFSTLGLITFLTAGEKEVRAWTIKKGTKAPAAAGVIHTDFEKKFIKAEVCDFGEFIELGGWKNARENGKVRQEGREYIVRDGDVVEFRIGA